METSASFEARSAPSPYPTTCRRRWLSREHFMSGTTKQRNPTSFNFLAILFQVSY
jgi:hypothetical protein